MYVNDGNISTNRIFSLEDQIFIHTRNEIAKYIQTKI
jgi:hypothetical protein